MSDAKTCPNCHHLADASANFCPACATSLAGVSPDAVDTTAGNMGANDGSGPDNGDDRNPDATGASTTDAWPANSGSGTPGQADWPNHDPSRPTTGNPGVGHSVPGAPGGPNHADASMPTGAPGVGHHQAPAAKPNHDPDTGMTGAPGISHSRPAPSKPNHDPDQTMTGAPGVTHGRPAPTPPNHPRSDEFPIQSRASLRVLKDQMALKAADADFELRAAQHPFAAEDGDECDLCGHGPGSAIHSESGMQHPESA